MIENLEKSLEVALIVKKWVLAENNALAKTLRDNPDLSDELQVFLGEVSTLTIQKYECIDDLIGLLAERKSMFGSDGLEKNCEYEEKDE